MTQTADDIEVQLRSPRFPHTLDYIGIAAVVAPFVISFRSTKAQSFSSTVNGVETAHVANTSYSDPIALGGGALALVIAFATTSLWRKTAPKQRAKRLVTTCALFVCGLLVLAFRSGLLY